MLAESLSLLSKMTRGHYALLIPRLIPFCPTYWQFWQIHSHCSLCTHCTYLKTKTDVIKQYIYRLQNFAACVSCSFTFNLLHPGILSRGMQRHCFLSSLTSSICKKVDLCVCVCTGKGRGDTSLSVVLMVPLTTQQLLHIGVVLAVGLKHKNSHTRACTCTQWSSTVRIKRASRSLRLFSPPNSLSLLCFCDGRIYVLFRRANAQHTPCCSHRRFYVCVSMCHVSPPSLACLLSCQRLAPAA